MENKIENKQVLIEFTDFDTEETLVQPFVNYTDAITYLSKKGYERCRDDDNDKTYEFVWEITRGRDTNYATVCALNYDFIYGETGTNDWDELENFAKKTWGIK